MSDSERGPASDEPISEEFKAFVGGISWHISDRELKDKFREFDAIGARVQLDKATGRSRGFGFVMFADEKGLKSAVAAMHQTDLDGRKISVTRAIPQNETVPGTPAAALNAGRRGGGGYDRRGPPAGYGGRYGGGGYPPERAYGRGGGGYEYGGGGYGRDPYGSRGASYPPRAPAYPDQRGGGYPPERGYDRGYGGGGAYGYDARAPDPYAGGGYSRDPYSSRDYYAGHESSYGAPPAAGGGYSDRGSYGRYPAPGAGAGYPDRYVPDDRSGAAAGYPPERSAYRGPPGDRPAYGGPPRPGGPP